ncbi:MAG: RNA polymerase sigma factor [Pyrinomonadaceae bacterium]
MPQVNHWQEFGRWWAESEQELLRVARRYGANPDESRDAVQDLAVLAVQNYKRFFEKAEFRRWAFARLHWLILDRFRFARRTSVEFSQDLVAPVEPGQESEILAHEMLELVRTLPTRQQEVVMMTIQGHSPAAIAEKMGITEATVRSLRRFGRSHLAALLARKVVKK